MGAAGPFRTNLPDSKRLQHALFGVYYEEDLFDRFCVRWPGAMRAFSWRIEAQILRRKLIFIHVPRVAGTSISRALYGPLGSTRHFSARYFQSLNPRFFAQAESFALLRDPFDRFASAYAFVRAGGTASCRLSDVFLAQTAHVRTVDDYLSFLEGREALALDFVMRPQSWFICDASTGAPLVKSLFLYGPADRPRLDAYLKGHGVTQLPWLNPGARLPLFLSARQKRRIETLYAQDFALVAALKGGQTREACAPLCDMAPAYRIAAE